MGAIARCGDFWPGSAGSAQANWQPLPVGEVGDLFLGGRVVALTALFFQAPGRAVARFPKTEAVLTCEAADM